MMCLLALPLCSCSGGEPCGYDETPLAASDETPWGTTLSDDIAALEIPQQGTWRWYPSTDELDIAEGGAELPATAQFVHTPGTMRFREHVAGGDGVACDGPTVQVDGVLTFTNEQDDVIVSIPITAERMHMAMLEYGATPVYSPITVFSTGLQEKVEYETNQILGRILWIEGERLLVEFYYNGQRMLTDTTGEGVFSLIAEFVPNDPP